MPNPDNVINNGKPFSSDNQPDPAAKSAGLKRWHERKKLRDDFFVEFSETTLGDGTKIDTFKEAVKVLKNAVLKSELPLKERADLIIKLSEFLAPTEKQEISATVTLDSTDVGVNKLAKMLDELKPNNPKPN